MLHLRHAYQKLITLLISVNNAEDLDIIMLMYNLLECNNDYSMTSGSW